MDWPLKCKKGPVRFAEKTSRNTILTDLLLEKNTILAEKNGLEEKRTGPKIAWPAQSPFSLSPHGMGEICNLQACLLKTET